MSTRRVPYRDTHRLISRRYADVDQLKALDLPAAAVENLNALASATDPGVLAQRGPASGLSIGRDELVSNIPEAAVINAAFTHPGKDGGRFHDRRRGAWYAATTLDTAQAEVGYHRARFVKNSRIAEPVDFELIDLTASFAGDFHRLTEEETASCMVPEPVPECYGPGQALANALLRQGASGVVYPSARRRGGVCLACFRPALVHDVRRGEGYTVTVHVVSGASPHVVWR